MQVFYERWAVGEEEQAERGRRVVEWIGRLGEPCYSCLVMLVGWCSHPVIYSGAYDNDRSDKNIEKGCRQKRLGKSCNVISHFNAYLCVISCHHSLFDCIPRWVNVVSLEGITRMIEALKPVPEKKQTSPDLGKECEQWIEKKVRSPR